MSKVTKQVADRVRDPGMRLDEVCSSPCAHGSISDAGCLLLPQVSKTASVARKVIVQGKGDFHILKKSTI